jgi:hypothetical protein
MTFIQSVTIQKNILRSLLRFSLIPVLSIIGILLLIVPASAANSTFRQAQEGDIEAARLSVANSGGVPNVVASYSAKPDLVGSQSGTIPLNGTLIPNTTTLNVSPGTTEPLGTTLQFTGSMSPYTFGTYIAGGTVTFYDGGTSLGSGSVSNGQALLTNNSLTPGSHSLTAVYSGDFNFSSSTSSTTVVTITKANPTITWATPAAITYGSPLSGTQLNATASVPGTFVYSPVAGTVLSAGTQTLSVTFTPTDTTHYNSVGSSVSLVVNKALLTVTANNASRAYGAANPAFTASYSGFVNGDTQSVLSGSPSLTTTATASSPVGSYMITAAAGTLSAGNYSFMYVNGTLTINKVASIITVASSKNPSNYLDSVTFTISVSGSGSGATPTGTVNVMQGATTLLPATAINASGQATYTTSSLAVGVDTVTVNYSGDSNYQ